MHPHSLEASDFTYEVQHFADIPGDALTNGQFLDDWTSCNDLSIHSGENGWEICHIQRKAEAVGRAKVDIHSMLSAGETEELLRGLHSREVGSQGSNLSGALDLVNDTLHQLGLQNKLKPSQESTITRLFRSYLNVSEAASKENEDENQQTITRLEELAGPGLDRAKILKLAEAVRLVGGRPVDKEELKGLLQWVWRASQGGDFADIPEQAFTDTPERYSVTWDSEHGLSIMSGFLGEQGHELCHIQRDEQSSADAGRAVTIVSQLSLEKTLKIAEDLYIRHLSHRLQVPDPHLLLDVHVKLRDTQLRKEHTKLVVKELFRECCDVTESAAQEKAEENREIIGRLRCLAGPGIDRAWIKTLAEGIRRYGRPVDEDWLKELLQWVERIEHVESSKRRLEEATDAA